MLEGFKRRGVALAAVILVVVVGTVVIFAVSGAQRAGGFSRTQRADSVSAQRAGSFCNAQAAGSTAAAAMNAYLRVCGSAYRIQKGPYDADKATSAYANYAKVVEYTINVANNTEGPVEFLMVGQRDAGENWRTLGPPGTGP